MDRDQLIKRLMATFLAELQDQVQALNRDLLALKKGLRAGERAECLKELFRTAHSLKGAARSVNVQPIEEACHHLEEILSGVRAAARPANDAFYDLVLETADAIEEAGQRLQEEQNLVGSPLHALLPRLAAAALSVPEDASLPPNATSPPREVESPRSAKPSDELASRVAPAPEKEPKAPVSVGGTLSLRIPAEKLDALLASSGELLIARRRIPLRIEELAAVRDAVARQRTDWHAMQKPLAQRLRDDGAVSREGRHVSDTLVSPGTLPRRLVRAMQEVGERVRQLEKDLESLTAGLMSDSRLLDHLAGALDEEVRRVRMLPFAEACQGLERIVHDLAQARGKDVELVIEGGEVELDRSVLEGLKDPLRHLVRNALDHGIEPPEERRAAGKPPTGRVTVSAVLRGAQVDVGVADDGRGIDLPALRRRVYTEKLTNPVDDRELARLVFQPGLSTSNRVTDISGRGIGLDVVKSRVEALHGTVDLTFTPGGGTRFSLDVPLTLTTLRTVLVVASGQTFAFVGTNVEKLLRVDPREFRSIGGRDMLSIKGAPLPVASLAETLGLTHRETLPQQRKLSVLIVVAGTQRLAFMVDELLSEQEVVVKTLGPRIRQLPHVVGATLLPSGQIALVLNAANLVRTALVRLHVSQHRPSTLLAAPSTPVRKRLLLAEDSLTTRTLEKTILEAAGYEVLAAVDGAQAWQLLQERGADLLVSDIEMPRMDGFALTEAVRTSPRFRGLPVVLVTSRANDADKARGLEVGANAYLVKSAFDQTSLLEIIAQLL